MAPPLTEDESAIDPYALLELSVDASAKDVQRAYRLKSLKYHPDKNPAPEAIALFQQISLAAGILQDQSKRNYLDTKLEDDRKKKARYAEMDKKRKKMVDDLVEREEQAKKARVEQQQRRRQEADEESIKDAGKRMLEEAQRRAMAASAGTAAPPAPAPAIRKSARNGENAPDITPESLTLILILPPTATISQAQLLKNLVDSYGAITHLILSDALPSTSAISVEGTKKKKTKSRKAVLEFAAGNWGGCYSCWKDVEDRNSEKLGVDGVKAKWAAGEAPSWVEWAETQLPSRRRPSETPASSFSFPHPPPSSATTAPSFSSAPAFSSSTSMADLLALHAKEKSSNDELKRKRAEAESLTLSRMRMMERERLEAEIKRQEEEE
ncbi:hypothetical protein IAR50_005436 [Cryptococcus sp. DSM 104548]